MKNQKTVFLMIGTYECQSYFNDDNDNGIEVFENENLLGSIVGVDIPDIEDEEANNVFDKEVEDWIVDNKF